MPKYLLENPTKEQENIVRQFLLINSDTFRITSARWVELGFLSLIRKGGKNDPKFIDAKRKLEKYFVKKIINNKRYDNLEQFKNSEFEHYFYKLSKEMKNRINKETLIWQVNPPENKTFYGFEDPVFYKKDKIIGFVISHECYIFLNLNKPEKKNLNRKGVKLEIIK